MNISLCGGFAITVGVLIIISTVTIHILYNELDVKWIPPMISRIPEKDKHEHMDFVFHCIRDEDHDVDTNTARDTMPTLYNDDKLDSGKPPMSFDDDERDE